MPGATSSILATSSFFVGPCGDNLWLRRTNEQIADRQGFANSPTAGAFFLTDFGHRGKNFREFPFSWTPVRPWELIDHAKVS